MPRTNPPSPYADVGHVVHISTAAEAGACHICNYPFKSSFAERVNHYLEKHGYRLLHVGVESSYEREGERVWNDTVAVLGKASTNG